MKELILDEVKKSIDVKSAILKSENIINRVEDIVKDCVKSLNDGGKIIFCGNGGSFADSQHLAAEFVSRLRFDRSPLAAIALGTNSSNLSAIGNDYGYDMVFTRELLALGKKEDIFIPISTSGNSSNVINAINAAKEKGMKIYGLTGGVGGKMSGICDVIIVPSDSVEKIQEVHIMLGHIICYLVESMIFKRKSND
jgi:D-sedoheptulose 7-phosphate isomerase